MPRTISNIVGLLLVAWSLLAPMRAAADLPLWMQKAAEESSAAAYPPDTNAVVLLDAIEDTVTAPGEYVEHYRRMVRILRREGREEGELTVHLRGPEKLISIHAWSKDKDGHEYELKEKDFQDRSPYSFELYSDLHFRSALAPASDPGSLVGFEYEVRRHGWLNQLQWFFQEDIPVRQAQFTLALPAGWEYKASFANAQSVTTENSVQGSQWTVRDVPPIDEEERMPPPYSLAGHAEISYFAPGGTGVASWEGLGRWYAGLTAGHRTASPEIAEKARQLTAAATDFDGKVRALAAFLQADVRYVAIEIGIGGYQPHPASDIFRARYGDCKDKATLLSSMLNEVGIGSDYVLIHTERGVVKPDLPSVMFNHAILAIELPDGVRSDAYQSVWTSEKGKRYLIFDPTDEYTPLGDLRGDLQDTYALLVTGDGGELIHTPLLAPGANTLARTGHFVLDADGNLQGEVIETLSGDHANRERYELSHATQQERTQQLERSLNQSLKSFTLESSDFQQLEQIQKDLVLTMKLTAPQYGQLRGPLMLVRPRVLGEKSFDIEHRKPRLYPITLHAQSRETDTYEIELPKNFTVDDLPDPVKLDTEWASYQSKIEMVGSKLRYSREYVVHSLRVSPEHFADFRKFEGAIGAEENSVVVLKHAE